MTAPDTTSTIPEILRKTADLLDSDGWTQGMNVTTEGKRCVYGAIRYVVIGTDATWVATEIEYRIDKAAAHFGRYLIATQPDALYEAHLPSVGIDWNDQFDRTQEQVTAALRAAADWTPPPEDTPKDG